MSRFFVLRGSLMLEVMVACALMAIILPLIGPAVWRLQERHRLAVTYLSQQTFHSALKSQFVAHWSRLRPAGCSVNDDVYLTIGRGTQEPSRLVRRDVEERSDWLEATDYGACRLSVGPLTNPLNISNAPACDLSIGDLLTVSTCLGHADAQVIRTSRDQTRLQLSSFVFSNKERQTDGSKKALSLLGQSGILESQEPFYWYVGQGKNGQPSFWRTPGMSGNSLELWSGLKRMAIFPLLDEDQDGVADTIDKHYGDYALSHTLGLWVEYLYQLPDCDLSERLQIEKVYHSMRGNVWHYQSPCQGVGNQIIVFNR